MRPPGDVVSSWRAAASGPARAARRCRLGGPAPTRGRVEPAGLGTVRQLRAELAQRLGVDLTHPALGDAEDVADLGEGQTVVVVHHQHGPLPLGHAVDGRDQRLLGLLGLEGVDRPAGAVREGLAERRALGAVAATQHLVERHHADGRDLAQSLVEVADAHLELGRDLGLVGRTPQRRLQMGERLLDRTGLGAHRAGHPVDGAELVDDRALDARNGVRLEPQVAVELETLDRVDQPDDAVADEILLVEVPWQPGQHTAGDVLHERRVVDDQLVSQRLPSGLLEL